MGLSFALVVLTICVCSMLNRTVRQRHVRGDAEMEHRARLVACYKSTSGESPLGCVLVFTYAADRTDAKRNKLSALQVRYSQGDYD